MAIIFRWFFWSELGALSARDPGHHFRILTTGPFFRLSHSNFRKCSVFAFKLFPFAPICAKGRHSMMEKVSSAGRRLYESSGGNQVDGLPPARHFGGKRVFIWIFLIIGSFVWSGYNFSMVLLVIAWCSLSERSWPSLKNSYD